MLVDPLFEKMRFRLDEDFCQWVYEMSDSGNAIYPNDDIPDLSKYMTKINHSCHFSQSTFEALTKMGNCTEDEKKQWKAILKKYGFHIMQGDREYITANDGYRGVHVYYQKSGKHYPIEIQFNTLFDRQLNNWLHDYLYKKTYPIEPGRIMRGMRVD